MFAPILSSSSSSRCLVRSTTGVMSDRYRGSRPPTTSPMRYSRHSMGRFLAAVVAILTLLANISLRADTTFVSAGSVWKYLDNGSDQGTAWRGTSFSDSSWASGPAELGYGDAGEARPE